MFVVIVEYCDKPKEYWGPFNSFKVEKFMEKRGLVQITWDDYRHWLNEKEGMSVTVQKLLKPE